MNLKINLDENIYLVQNIAFLMVKIIDKKINIYKKIEVQCELLFLSC